MRSPCRSKPTCEEGRGGPAPPRATETGWNALVSSDAGSGRNTVIRSLLLKVSNEPSRLEGRFARLNTTATTLRFPLEKEVSTDVGLP